MAKTVTQTLFSSSSSSSVVYGQKAKKNIICSCCTHIKILGVGGGFQRDRIDPIICI